MSEISRRKALRVMGGVPVVAGLTWTRADASQRHQHAPPTREVGDTTHAGDMPRFFTAHEYATVVMLADIIIPKDDRSGSATDAGVPAFIDYTMAETLTDEPDQRTAIRGGLAWLDAECQRRFDNAFVACTDAQRTEILDDIAWPGKARPEMSHGVRFFSLFRDLVASGFWSSKIGVEDLQFMGNSPLGEWTGAPSEALQKLGVSYD